MLGLGIRFVFVFQPHPFFSPTINISNDQTLILDIIEKKKEKKNKICRHVLTDTASYSIQPATWYSWYSQLLDTVSYLIAYSKLSSALRHAAVSQSARANDTPSTASFISHSCKWDTPSTASFISQSARANQTLLRPPVLSANQLVQTRHSFDRQFY